MAFYILNLFPTSFIVLLTSSDIVFIIKLLFKLFILSSSVVKKNDMGTSKNVAKRSIVSGETQFYQILLTPYVFFSLQ